MELIITSILLGVGLAMDAFSVSVADGFNESSMKRKKAVGIAGIFAIFQMAMPLIGWVCVHTIAVYFEGFRYAIPWIALCLLGYIGGKMVYGYFKGAEEEESVKKLGVSVILLQGVATSIDALSVGFTIAEYGFLKALLSAGIIGVVTLFICIAGLFFGKKFGTKFSHKAELIGGLILIGIGIEIFVSNMIELF